MDWLAAKKTCESDGAKLPVPRSIEENNFFGKLAREKNRYIWLGINDITKDGEFVDLDGIPISFQNWNKGEPNNYMGKDEDAVVLQGGMHFDQLLILTIELCVMSFDIRNTENV